MNQRKTDDAEVLAKTQKSNATQTQIQGKTTPVKIGKVSAVLQTRRLPTFGHRCSLRRYSRHGVSQALASQRRAAVAGEQADLAMISSSSANGVAA